MVLWEGKRIPTTAPPTPPSTAPTPAGRAAPPISKQKLCDGHGLKGTIPASNKARAECDVLIALCWTKILLSTIVVKRVTQRYAQSARPGRSGRSQATNQRGARRPARLTWFSIVRARRRSAVTRDRNGGGKLAQNRQLYPRSLPSAHGSPSKRRDGHELEWRGGLKVRRPRSEGVPRPGDESLRSA